MKYYTDTNGNLYANPSNLEGLVEVESAVRADGTLLPKHKNLGDVETREDGSYYGYYLQDGMPDLVKEQEVELRKVVADGEALVEAYIKTEVDKLNTSLGTKFDSIHAVANYKDSIVYPHAALCKALWDWNEQVWMVARAKQEQAIVDRLSAEEFIAMLPILGA